jgi:hypothetical protein
MNKIMEKTKRKSMSESAKIDRVHERLTEISKYIQQNKTITDINSIGKAVSIDTGFVSYLKNNNIIIRNNSNYFTWNKTIPLSVYPLAKTCYDNYYKVKTLKQIRNKNTESVAKITAKTSTRKYTKKTITTPTNDYWNFLGGLIKIKKW